MREKLFVSNEFYHVYNRGVDKRSVFLSKDDIKRFYQSMIEFNTLKPIGSLYELALDRKLNRHGRRTSIPRNEPRLVEIICYCLNKNHYHFILKPLVDNGISEFMKRLGGGYTKHFNNKYKRSGVLFESGFKAIQIDSNEYLLHLSAYINLNDRIHNLKNNLSQSSWGEYTGNAEQGICSKGIVLSQFRSKKDYKGFAAEALENIYQKKKMQKEVKELTLE